MKKPQYTEEFYLKMMDESLVYSADRVLSVVLPKLPTINSVIDVGCGLGTWLVSLSRLKSRQVDIFGIDGPWLDPNLLVIPKDSFQAVDLSSKMPRIERRYDFAISLEVAEHLPPEKAEEFISFLAGLSDFVLFSAAIPFQGGTNHFNEQWQDYWAELFKQRGYIAVDFIRPAVWNDEKIPFHYRQNTILYSKEGRIKEINLPSLLDGKMLSISHPECYTTHARPGVKRAFRMFRASISRSIVRWFRGNKTPVERLGNYVGSRKWSFL